MLALGGVVGGYIGLAGPQSDYSPPPLLEWCQPAVLFSFCQRGFLRASVVQSESQLVRSNSWSAMGEAAGVRGVGGGGEMGRERARERAGARTGAGRVAVSRDGRMLFSPSVRSAVAAAAVASEAEGTAAAEEGDKHAGGVGAWTWAGAGSGAVRRMVPQPSDRLAASTTKG